MTSMLQYLDPRRWVAAAQGFLSPTQPPSTRETGPFTPTSATYADVCVTRAILESRGLPTEVVLDIMEYADYAPVRVFTDPRALVSVPVGNGISMLQCVTAGVLSKDTIHSLAARTADIKVKEIEFVISSRDQGWTSEGTEGTFNTSSWLEASIVRRAVGAEDGTNPQLSVQLPLSAYVHPGTYQPEALARGKTLVERPEEAGSGIQNGEGNLAWYLQGNRVASLGRFEKYRVAWRTNGYEGNEGAGNGVGFLETLREGDEVIVWARAKYPGWSCVVSSVKVTVRYSFSERDSAAA